MGSIRRLKQTVVEQLLDAEDYFMIVVDPTYRGVVMPQHLLESRQPVGINIGHQMAVPIPDLLLDEASVQGTLSFSRSPFHCTFPWDSIVQISVEDEHLVWVMPPVEQGKGESEQLPSDEAQPKGRPQLRLV
ncbi:MAG: hypothetical protein CSA65_09800 [Proteobacteria bacterium]|nr:MAG: hypothetical protein CSA65_09800 [Pseudomonadota bacterium]